MRVVVGTLLMYVALGTAARAEPVHSGPQSVPPVRRAEPILSQELDGRRAVRGCATDETCGRPGDPLHEIDVELFPPPGGSPWLDERALAPSRLEAGPTRRVTRPSELRPDQPWLDQLELPDLPVRWSQRLVDYLVFYKNDPRGRAIISSWLVAQGRYRELISRYLRKARLPQDLMYVAMIESSYDPNTLSRAGALGLWQFMPEAARIYGLRQDRWVDERRDPYRATVAQMDYFADLYQRFGDWHVALASFNVGYGAMLRSIAKYNTNDYYQLCAFENGLPWETCLYTPKVLATAIVGHNRALFGFDKLQPRPAEVWDDVAVPTSLTLGLIARAAGTTEAEIKRLNPHLRRGRTPPNEPGYVVRVPPGTRAETQRRIAELQSDWDGYDAYVVAHGERFEDIATTFGISRSALRRLNGVEHESEIGGGTVLVVPRISTTQRTKNQAKAKANLLGSGVDHKEGERLIVPVADKDFAIEGRRRVFYRVVTGDTVGSVARAFGVTRAEISLWNAIELTANLHPRMVLVAFVPPDFDADRQRIALLDARELVVVTRGSPEHLDAAEERTGRARVEHVAAGTEKLAEVARRYGMTKYDLARINRISASTVLEKGDTVIVYKVVDPTRSDRAKSQWKKTPRPKAKPSTKRKKVAEAKAGEKPSDAKADKKADRKAGKKADRKAGKEAEDTAPKPEAKAAVNTARTVQSAKTRTADGPVTKPTQVD